MSKRQNVLLIPDVQLPYHDPVILKKIIKIAETYQPDLVVQIGDLIDMPQVSRWNKGDAGEYSLTLKDHIEQTKDEFFSPLRKAAPKAAITWVSGNHDERLADYMKRYAYPIQPLMPSMGELFELDKFGAKYVKGPVRIATNVYAVHGHESGGYCASASAWDTKLTKRYGSDKSYVFGHTHQGFLISRATGWHGNVSPRFTLNVGSIMDPANAGYVKDGSVSWVPSFGWIEDDGKRTWPELILFNDRLARFKGSRI